ncbi:hypothetical protein Tco_0650281 [Tanacetum coccineum]
MEMTIGHLPNLKSISSKLKTHQAATRTSIRLPNVRTTCIDYANECDIMSSIVYESIEFPLDILMVDCDSVRGFLRASVLVASRSWIVSGISSPDTLKQPLNRSER